MVEKVQSGGERIFVIVCGIVFILGFIATRIFPISASSVYEKIVALSILMIGLMVISFYLGFLLRRMSSVGYVFIFVWGITAIPGLIMLIAIVWNKGWNHMIGVALYVLFILMVNILPFYIGRWISQKRLKSESQVNAHD